MKALQVDRTRARFAAARLASAFAPGGGSGIGPLRLVDIDPPELPGPEWVRVRPRLTGVCGSDLSTVEGHSSLYFDAWVSFPFVPGHEVVGTRLDDGSRVVLEPVLGHAARGFPPPFDGAAPGDGDDYAHLALGALEPGIQTGFCASTGGGWSTELVAHPTQLHAVPEDWSDERAVMLEPLAGGVHAALSALSVQSDPSGKGAVIAVLGAGTMGLCAVAALRGLAPDATLVVGARYRHQQRFARELGADHVVAPDELPRAVRRIVGCHVVGGMLTGGTHATVDAVGTSASITSTLGITRPRGRIVLLGMPAEVTVDLTALWHRETQIVGAYTYGTERLPDGSTRSSFDVAFDIAPAVQIERLVSASYRLADHADAIAHAADAGRRGAVKIVFDLTTEKA
jgi:threonine dehydrogenase-like Zn-dependent dehydrogenase